MRLLSIENDEENEMIFAGLNTNHIFKGKFTVQISIEIIHTAGVFWTSGRDVSGRGNFEWTAIKHSIGIFENWAPGQPEVGMGFNFLYQCVKYKKHF